MLPKPNTHTQAMFVDATGISGPVTRITMGGLLLRHWLLMLSGIRMELQKSAEALVGWSPPTEGLNIGYESELVDSMMLHTTRRGRIPPDLERAISSLRVPSRYTKRSGMSQNNAQRELQKLNVTTSDR